MIFGIGCDVCALDHLEKSLSGPHAAAFVRRVYGPAECTALALDTPLPAGHSGAHRLASAAADFAAKEAFLKAWCAAISRHAKDGAEVAYPYTLDNFPWVRIEILDDSHGVPRVVLSSEVQRKVQQSLGLPLDPVRQSYDISISISHDGPIASAVVMLEI